MNSQEDALDPVIEAHDEGSLEKYLQEGIDLIQSKDLALAIEKFDRIITDYDDTYGHRSDKLFLSFLSREEFLAFVKGQPPPEREVVWLHPYYSQAHYYKGYALVQLERTPEACAEIQRAIDLNPMHGPFYLELAYIHARQRDFDRALQLYNNALERDYFPAKSATAAAYRGIGYIYIESGMLSEAVRMYEKSLELEPESSIARQELDY
ncbi:MAG: tetratricopeptide repeat protein, partial [Chloroflexota bacterium]